MFRSIAFLVCMAIALLISCVAFVAALVAVTDIEDHFGALQSIFRSGPLANGLHLAVVCLVSAAAMWLTWACLCELVDWMFREPWLQKIIDESKAHKALVKKWQRFLATVPGDAEVAAFTETNGRFPDFITMYKRLEALVGKEVTLLVHYHDHSGARREGGLLRYDAQSRKFSAGSTKFGYSDARSITPQHEYELMPTIDVIDVDAFESRADAHGWVSVG